MEHSTRRYLIDMRAESAGKPMEGAKDHPDTEAGRSDQATELDSMDWTGTPVEDSSESEAQNAVDLSGLYDLKEDGSDRSQTSLVMESGLWPDLVGSEARTDHSLDVDLDDLCAPESKYAEGRGDEVRPVSHDPEHGSQRDLVCPGSDDRFTRTIMDLTGWSLDRGSIIDDPLFCPVFTDGEKTYEFADWKIYITFRGVSGIATLDWSPETLEEDVKRAASLEILRSHDAEELAAILRRHFSSQQLRDLVESLTDNTEG